MIFALVDYCKRMHMHEIERVESGSLVTVRGLLTFTSNRSLEIEVIVEYESIIGKESDGESADVRQKAVDAFFTFVSIDSNGKAIRVPSLVVNSICANCFIHILHKNFG